MPQQPLTQPKNTILKPVYSSPRLATQAGIKTTSFESVIELRSWNSIDGFGNDRQRKVSPIARMDGAIYKEAAPAIETIGV